MAFWSERQVEPKRKFRWLLYWTGVPQFVVKSVKKPSFSVETTAHQFLNYEFNYPGRVKWNPIDITIVDPVNPDSTKSLYKILENSGYVIPSEYNEAEAATISKKGMVEALGTEIKLVQLDADGINHIETWVIKNPLITSAEFDTLDYSQDDLLNISISITYDYATIEGVSGKKNFGPGAVGRWDFNSQEGDGIKFNPVG
tara:strand:+ start:239 stop:838 length:600 start_codon:yes stop_codon:yes gene_type:complete